MKSFKISIISLILALSACAREQDDLSTLTDKGLAAMNAQQWQDGLAFNAEAIERFGKNNPLQSHGPRFGVIYYRKGLCELKLKMWKEAMRSFEICYQDFPNVGSSTSNQFNKLALLKWGEAAVGAGNWQLALTRFEKFRIERNKLSDEYPAGLYHINVAICHYKLGNLPAGNASLEIAIYNKDNSLTPGSVIAAGLQAMVRCAMVKKNEQALLDFIDKNRGKMIMNPGDLWNSTPILTGLAAETMGAEMDCAAIALFQLSTPADVRIGDLKTILKSIGIAKEPTDFTAVTSKSSLEKELSELESPDHGKPTPETSLLTATAFIHEKYGNLMGAYAAYRQLELYHSTSSQRESNLYHLVRTGSKAAAADETRRWAEIFEKNFPTSKYISAVRNLAVSARNHQNPTQAAPSPTQDSSNHFGTNPSKPTRSQPTQTIPIQAKAHRIGVAGDVSTIWLVGATHESIRYRETEFAKEVVEQKPAEMGAIHLCEPSEYSAAMDLFQGRKYADALEKFAKVKHDYQAFESLENNPGSLAAFQELECLRKLGDLDGLAAARGKLVHTPLTRDYQLRQLELCALWEAVRSENWKLIDQLANDLTNNSLTSGQRVQTAYCHALALERLQKPYEAMMAYQTALTADCGASEEITRQSALRILAILHQDEGVKNGSDPVKIAELAAMAELYEITLGAGSPLPAIFKKFLVSKP